MENVPDDDQDQLNAVEMAVSAWLGENTAADDLEQSAKWC